MRSYPAPLQVLAVALAFLAGFIDALAFTQLGGFFVSFMSGNSTRLGVGLAGHAHAAGIAASLIAGFVMGVILGSLAGRRSGLRRRPVVISLVTALLMASALVQKMYGVYPASLLLSLAMGAMNATFEREGELSLGVTYMTGALVKAGQALASALSGGPRWRWIAPLILWLGLVSGAICGALSYAAFRAHAVWFAVLLSVLLALFAGVDQSRET